MKKPIVSLAVAAGLLVSTAPAAIYAKPLAVQSQVKHPGFDHKVVNNLNVENTYNHIRYLSQTPRVAGTPDEENAVRYVKEQFESYGYKTEIQEFTFIGYTPPSKIELKVAGFDNLKPDSFTYSVNGDINGELVLAGLGTKEELAGKDLTGKIALIERGSISFGEKVINASEAGAAGVIIYNNAEGSLNGTLGEMDKRYVPVLSLSKAEGEALAAVVKKGGVTANLKIEGADAGERTSHNVIATKPATNKNKAKDGAILMGAHHDSVPGAPGANDDASGTASVLELARVFKDIPTDTELRFITFGAEELGLLGSEHYVSTLTQEEARKIIGYFNMDMVGSKDAGDLSIKTVDGNPNIVSQLSQASSKRLNGLPTPLEEGGRSDHVPFFEAGIPSASFIHTPTEPWYHTPEDTLDKISKEKLLDVAEIVGTAVYSLAHPDNQGPKTVKTPKAAKPQDRHEQNIK
ncbi:M20/M25/M40 family metallo-hydrolase [Bacillus massilinigeriensis]|uniref:M20/M25/M40 family metallo-hydrolase n=1 Tax=Bacillus mediterraneensis TaxID=1805474 RepID=UPI0008F82F14|nr:M20/M25/M40 family metallo-hydrolase [Bacillus mediterraneensis]